MREKIILFSIGILVGAVVSTGVFLTFIKTSNMKNCNDQRMQMAGGNPPIMPDMQGAPGVQPPARAGEGNIQSKTETSNK